MNAFADLEPEERERLAWLGSVLFMVGSLTAVPAGLFLEPAPAAHEYLIAAAGFLLGAVTLAFPWARMAPGWLHFFPLVGTLIVVAGVAVFSVVFSFFLVLAGMFVAVSVRQATVFSAYMAFFVFALLLPFNYESVGASEQAITILATLPVLLIVALVSRYMHEVVEHQKEQYRDFASEALALGERIRGSACRVNEDSTEDLAARLKDLRLASSVERRDWSSRPTVWPPAAN